MFAAVPSAALLGVEGHPVTVEVHASTGLPGFTVVGLPDEVCREARDRVRAALLSSGFGWPTKRTTVNLAPSRVHEVPMTRAAIYAGISSDRDDTRLGVDRQVQDCR